LVQGAIVVPAAEARFASQSFSEGWSPVAS